MKKILIILMFMGSSILAQESTKNNIATYCKIWGVCKYYSDNNVDWDNVFFKNYENIINSNNRSDLNNQLDILLQKTGFKFTLNKDTSITSATLLKKWGIKDTTKYFLRTNFDWISNSNEINTINKNRLIQLIASYKKKKPKTISVKSQVIAHNKELVYKKFNKKIALLALFRMYNVIEYYYPYKHLLDNDWDSVLTKTIPKFVNCQNIAEYKDALRILSNYLQDSHVGIDFEELNISNKKVIRNVNKKYPITFKYIDHKLYISNILNDSVSNYYQMKIGNEILEVNGKNISSILLESEQFYSFSTKEQSQYALFSYLRKMDSLILTIGNKNILLKKVKMSQDEFLNLVQYNKLKNGIEETKNKIGKNTGYIYLPSSKYFRIDNIFRKYKNKETIILDCRGYGTMAALKLAKLLSKKSRDVASLYLPVKKYPGVFEKKKNENYYFSNTIDVIGKLLFGYKNKVFPTFNTPYKGKVVVLIDDNAISFGETVIMLIKAYTKNAVFIGRPTTGANGNVTSLKLPLGGALDYTGIDFRFPDGSELQRKGIQPDIYVPKTIEATINGEDEILEAALKYINDER